MYHSSAIPFNALGVGMLVAAGLAFLLPKAAKALPSDITPLAVGGARAGPRAFP